MFDPQVVTPDEPYIERSFYFTSDNSDRYDRGEAPTLPTYTDGRNSRLLQIKKPEDKLRIPPEVVQGSFPRAPAISSRATRETCWTALRMKTPTWRSRRSGRAATRWWAPPRAQYTASTGQAVPAAVEGSDANGVPIEENNNAVPRYVTTVSRMFVGDATQTLDSRQVSGIDNARRIELRPHWHPDLQQVLVAGNGGTPVFPNQSTVRTTDNPNPPAPVQRDNELVKLPPQLARGEPFRNIYDGDSDKIPDALLISPIVAVPVANMSLSEPLDLYDARRKILADEEKANVPGPPGTNYTLVSHYWDPLAAQGEGVYMQNVAGGGAEGPYDTPFDEAPELRRNGTTRNYRTIHLQRLADPTLPWNPLPTLADGKPNPQHDPKLPVNLYRTIDTASVDLTAFNGTSRREPDMARTVVQNEAKWLPHNDLQFRDEYGFQGRTSTNQAPAQLPLAGARAARHRPDYGRQPAARRRAVVAAGAGDAVRPGRRFQRSQDERHARMAHAQRSRSRARGSGSGPTTCEFATSARSTLRASC